MRTPLLLALLVLGCDGEAFGVLSSARTPPPVVKDDPVPQKPKDPVKPDPKTEVPAPADQWSASEVQLRRLSRVELAFALEDALEVTAPELFDALPPDDGAYDNNTPVDPQRPSSSAAADLRR